MQLKNFDLWFMFAFDFSIFVKDESQDKLQKIRSEDDFFQNFWEEIYKQNIPFGEFLPRFPDYRQTILSSAKETILKGGKNVFSSVFINKYAPVQFNFISQSLNEFPKPGEKLKGFALNIKNNTLKKKVASKEIMQSKEVTLNFFRNGAISLSIKISESNNWQCSSHEFIEIAIALQLEMESFFRKTILNISNSLIDKNSKISKLIPDIKFKEVDLNATRSDICHGRPYRLLVINPDLQKQQFIIKQLSTGEKQELLGLLNSAEWFSQYNENYTDSMIDNALSYKSDELFICDNNASIIVLPAYWSIYELNGLISNIKLLTELINSQLIFTTTLNGLIEEFLLSDGSSIRKNAFQFATQIKKLLLTLERTSDVSAFVIHGFTQKFIENLCEGVSLSKRTEMVYTKMKLLDEQITLRAQEKNGQIQRLISVIAVLIALISMSITLLNSLYNSYMLGH